MKKRMISIIIALILTVASVVCMALVSSAEETASATLTAASEGEIIDVWLVAGQSNAIGSAKVDNYPTDEAYADYKTLLTNGSQNVWHIRNDYTDFVPAAFSQGSGTYSGPEIGIATALDKSANKNAIIKVAYGNTCLYENTSSKESKNYGTWTPPTYIDKHGISTVGNRTGDLYLSFISKVAYGLSELKALGYTPNIKGVWYMQGEADTLTSSTTTARYEELLLTLISDMRADLTEVSGTDCSELPFVYGRILSNHENVGKTVPSRLTHVQAAQDNVAANTSLKNVFMINTTTDLVDPATGEHRLPVQQDGWHYDSLSQQMIGEKFVAVVNQEERELTKYGYIPTDYADKETYPFAVFKKIDGSYVFDSVSTYSSTSDKSWETAMTRAITLTKSNGTAVTEEAVVLLRRDLDTTSFLQHTSDIGATVTVDLNGYSFTSRTSLCNTKTDDCLETGATEAKNGVINVKNGTLLMGNFGILYAAKNGTYTKEKTLTFNFEDLNIGFATNAKATCKTLLGIAYDSHAGDVVAEYEMNFVNCVIDSVTNCPTDSSYRIADLDATGESAENGYNNAVSITFKECTIKINNINHLNIPMSAEGDSVKFLKGEDGSYGKVIIPTGTYTDKFDGIDGDYEVELALAVKNGVYYLVESADVETAYGTIPAAYSNSYAYPYAVFKKIDGSYVFDSVQSNVNTSFTQATLLTKSGVTDDVVILARHSIGSDGSYPLNVADASGMITLDLNGHTIRPTTALIRTDFDDDGVVNGAQKKLTVNIKNGSMELCQFGILFTTIGTTYTVPKTIDLNLEGVKLGFYEVTSSKVQENYKWRDLLASDRGNSSTTKAYINIKATNCIFDLETAAQSNAVLGTFECGSKDLDMNDYKLEIIGGTIITDNISKVNCLKKGTGDSLIFKKDTDGKYPRILMNQKLIEPASTESRSGENGKALSFVETREKVGIYKVYDMCEDVMTKYGRIPYVASVNDFAVFVRNGSEAYTYYGAYGGWKLAFEAARDATNGSDTAYDEAVVFMLRDSTETSVPYHQNASGIINLDLNGKKLIVKGSFFNTYLTSSNSPTSTVNVFNGTLHTYRYGLIYTALKGDDTTYESAGVAKTIMLNFDNVNLGFEEYTAGTNSFLAAYAYAGSATVNMTVNMNFENCYFDLVNNATASTIIGRGKSAVSATTNTNTVDFNLAFEGCEFFVYTPSQISMAMSDSGDSFVINKGADGKYANVITSTAKEEVYADIIPGNNGTSAVKLRTSYAGLKDGYAKYELVETDGNITVTTSYGVIPSDYVNIASYPFAVFYKDANGKYQFKAAYATYKTAMEAAIGLTTAAIASPSSEAVVLLRSDWSGGTFPNNLSNIATTVTVDLNGYTLGALESLGNTKTGDVKDPNGNIVKTNGTINYKNGSLLMKVHPGLYIASGTTYTAGYQKTLNVNFDNIYFGLAAGAKTIALLGRIASNLTTETAIFNLKYTNCVIDMKTNYSTGSNFCIGNWAPTSGTDASKVTVDFVDCEFLGLTEADFVHRVKSGQDTVRYSRTEGNHYATLTLPRSAVAPTGKYTLADGKTGVFVKAYETADSVVYRLVPEEIASLSYAPKMSITLANSLVMNVYVPVNCTEEFTFNGVTYNADNSFGGNVVTIDGKDYYLVTVALGSSEAAKELPLVAKVTVGEKTASATFTFSIPKYAAKVIVSDEAAEIEKTLARDVLAYIKEAYKYFGTDHNSAAEITRVTALIESIIGDYTAAPVSTGTTVNAAGVTDVTLNLDAKPTIRFYVTDTAIEFSANGKKLNTVTGTDAKGTYAELDVYAYALCETVTFGNGGSYHISEFAKGCVGEAHEALVNSFICYVESAAAYRNYIIAQQ